MATSHVTLETIEKAAERLRGQTHVTPAHTCGLLNEMAGCNLFFKCEHLQKTGSFKIRGALNAVSKLVDDTPDSAHLKVVTHSSGNFGQALAYAAQVKGIEAYVVMPSNAPLCKFNAVQGYGASVTRCEPTEKCRAETAEAVSKETGAHFISSSQSHDVISGQGTIGLELLKQVPGLDAVVVPVGGGGMLAGVATVIKSIKKDSVKVYAAEPSNADDCYKSLYANERIPLPDGPVDTVADGLRVSIGELTWPIIAKHVDDVFLVSEDEIKNATRLAWQYLKQFVEPSAAVVLAVALSPKFAALQHRNVALVLSGGNVDLKAVKQWI